MPEPDPSGQAPEPIPLARAVLGEQEERAVVEVLRSGRLSLGPKLVEFERAFADRVGAAHASATSSGTAGLHLALRAAGVGEGEEVITTPFSFVASANSILYQRAKPVFVDIDPVTLNLDPAAAEAAVSERTTALLPVHIFGHPADMEAFERIAAVRGLAIVEDACQALGGVHADGVPVGGRGNPAVFAFYANKQMTTAEGGMIVTADPSFKAHIDSERNQGRAPDMSWLDHDRLGFNYRLNELSCAIGLVQLTRLDDLLAARARVAALYRDALGQAIGAEPPAGGDPGGGDPAGSGDSAPGRNPARREGPGRGGDPDGLVLPCEDRGAERRGWFVFVVQLPRACDRDSVIRRLAERGIESKPYLPAIHLMSFYRERLGHRPGQFPVCEDVASRSLALPFFPQMSEGQVARVAQELAHAVEQ